MQHDASDHTMEALSRQEALCSLPRIAAGSCPFRQSDTPASVFLSLTDASPPRAHTHDTVRGADTDGDSSPPPSVRVQNGTSGSSRARTRLGVCDEDLVAAKQSHAPRCPRTRREKPQSHRFRLMPFEAHTDGEDTRLALLGVCDEDLLAARLRSSRQAPTRKRRDKMQSPI